MIRSLCGYNLYKAIRYSFQHIFSCLLCPVYLLARYSVLTIFPATNKTFSSENILTV